MSKRLWFFALPAVVLLTVPSCDSKTAPASNALVQEVPTATVTATATAPPKAVLPGESSSQSPTQGLAKMKQTLMGAPKGKGDAGTKTGAF